MIDSNERLHRYYLQHLKQMHREGINSAEELREQLPRLLRQLKESRQEENKEIISTLRERIKKPSLFSKIGGLIHKNKSVVTTVK
jgi:hypothetical protein